LDEAFATINTPAHPSAPPVSRPEAHPPRPERPVLEGDLESFDQEPLIEPPPMLMETADPFAGIDAIETDEASHVPTLDDLLAGMPPPEPAHVIDFPSPPPPAAVPLPLNVAPPTIEPPETPPTLAPAPPTPEPIRVEALAPRAPSVVERHSRA